MTQAERISELLLSLDDDNKEVCKQIYTHLVSLGYTAKKQKVSGYSLLFTHKKANVAIAKLRTKHKQPTLLRFDVRFFACKHLPQKFADALRNEIVSKDGQYCCEISDREKVIDNRCFCGYCAEMCTGGGYGYYYQSPDGKEYRRCGAYMVPMFDLTLHDIRDIKILLTEQHEYFMSLA